MRLVGMVAGIDRIAGFPPPLLADPLHHPFHRLRVLFPGTEVPRFAETRPFLAQPLRQYQVAGERFENMLPGANGVGVPDEDLLAPQEGSDAIGHEAVAGPVSSADHIAGARGGDRRSMRGELPSPEK